MVGDSCSCDWLGARLQSAADGHNDDAGVLLLDCRSADEYLVSHVRGSMLVTIPSIMMRRLRNGSVPVTAVIGGGAEGGELFAERWKTDTVVLFDGGPVTTVQFGCGGLDGTSPLSVLMARLKSDGCQVRYLQGSYITSFCTLTVPYAIVRRRPGI